MMTDEIVLNAVGISKSFPGVKTLDKVSLEVHKGEVLALVGENGAGKSSLMKVLLGIYDHDEGKIFFKGRLAAITNPRSALNLGLAMIHQEINLNPHRSIAENIWLGREATMLGGLVIDWRQMYDKTKKLLNELGMRYEAREKVGNLTVAAKQLIEVARAISYKSDVLVMDEPTSALSEHEVAELFGLIKLLKSRGISIIFISHRLDEVFQIADRITVLRDGKNVGSLLSENASKEEVIRMMVGREITKLFPKVPAALGMVALEVKHLSTRKLLKDISFSVREGDPWYCWIDGFGQNGAD